MAIYTRPDSPFFWMLLERPDGGKPIRESTKVRADAPTKEQRKDAQQLAEEIYHTRMTALARTAYRLPDHRAAAGAFAEWARWYLAHVVAGRRSAERDASIVEMWIRVFAGASLTDVTRARVREWLTLQRETPRTAKPTRPGGKERTLGKPNVHTLNREVAVLKAMLQSAVEHGKLEASPLYGMPLLEGKKVKRRLLTPEEEQRLQGELAPADWALFLVGSTGLVRLGDILDLRWDDDHGDELYVAFPKMGEPYTVPVAKRLRSALATVPRNGSEYIFAHRRLADTERDRAGSVRQAFKKACRRAKVPYGRDRGGVTFHWATRRTGASRMLAKGVDIPAVQRLGNWASPTTLLGIYAEAMPPNVRRAVDLVAPPSGEPPVDGEPGTETVVASEEARRD